MTPEERITELEEAQLRLLAKVVALETLCAAILTYHPEKGEVIAKFSRLKERLAANTLADPDLQDAVPAELNAAHEDILKVIRSLD